MFRFTCRLQRLQSWKDRRKKQSQVFEAGGQNDTPLDQIQDPAERVAAFRRVCCASNAQIQLLQV